MENNCGMERVEDAGEVLTKEPRLDAHERNAGIKAKMEAHLAGYGFCNNKYGFFISWAGIAVGALRVDQIIVMRIQTFISH
jgi:hypothetical protein